MGAMQMPRQPDAPLLSLFAANLPWDETQTIRRLPRGGAEFDQRAGGDLLRAHKRGGGFFGRREVIIRSTSSRRRLGSLSTIPTS